MMTYFFLENYKVYYTEVILQFCQCQIVKKSFEGSNPEPFLSIGETLLVFESERNVLEEKYL